MLTPLFSFIIQCIGESDIVDRSVFWKNKWQHYCNTGTIYINDDYCFDMHDLLYVSRLVTEKILFLTIGVSGSGKTTFSTFLEQHYACEVYEQDVMVLENIGFYEQTRIYNHMLNNSKMVCVDATNLTTDMRSRFIHPARQRGFTIVAVVFNTDSCIIMDRNARRGNMDLEKILEDMDRLQIPQQCSETDITLTYDEFMNIFVPKLLPEDTTMFDLRRGWII